LFIYAHIHTGQSYFGFWMILGETLSVLQYTTGQNKSSRSLRPGRFKLCCFIFAKLFHLQSKFDGCKDSQDVSCFFSSPCVSVFLKLIYGSNNDITTKLWPEIHMTHQEGWTRRMWMTVLWMGSRLWKPYGNSSKQSEGKWYLGESSLLCTDVLYIPWRSLTTYRYKIVMYSKFWVHYYCSRIMHTFTELDI